jgi:hypothetical protein
MIGQFFRYLFPARRLADKLPKLGRGYSSRNYQAEHLDTNDVDHLLTLGAVHSREDAHRLAHKIAADKQAIARATMRKRKRVPRLRKAVARLRGILGL